MNDINKRILQGKIEGSLLSEHMAEVESVDHTLLDKPISVVKRNGDIVPFDKKRLWQVLSWANNHVDKIDVALIIEEVKNNIFNGISVSKIDDALIMATGSFIERDPIYGYVAARLLARKLFKEVTTLPIMSSSMEQIYRNTFVANVREAIEAEVFDKRLALFDLEQLAAELVLERDDLFDYMGFKTVYERYFAKIGTRRIELPQAFWMRIAMGLALEEQDRNERAIEFYHLLSSFYYMSGTPTLLHSGLVRPQLSSCFLTTVGDDLVNIFKCLGDNAQLSKWSGGVANDWTPLRATGALIKSINVEAQGVIPFLKIANDVTAAISRSGSRRGATCVYLETWHFDIEDFLDLRRNTGDDRRRTHDINTANWVPDLFMKRVMEDGEWTLFSPDEVPDLHDLYGAAFEKRYHEYERMVEEGTIKLHKKISALGLWRKMLSRLFETGHPWITFKDACNVRSPQDHVGVVHSSNLCTEITLNTSVSETAVCNLGSVNLERHIVDGKLDTIQLAKTVETAMRMLDNVIDINFYPTVEAQNANMRHRPVGLGLMGLQDALYKKDLAFDSPEALAFADEVMERISYYAILSSSKLAKEKGAYQSYKGSKWDRGIFPFDTLDLLERERGMMIETPRISRLDWTLVREHVKKYGMRNSNTMAIAPTATISNIVGCIPCIEPIYKNLYVKSNMSGEFTVVNQYLVKDLKERNLWNKDMLDQIKYFDGSLQNINIIPQDLKDKYKEAFEVDPEWLIEITAARGKWIDQSQSHNVFMKGVSGKKLHDIYFKAWRCGLKTTYYLRTLGATQIEKSTLDASKYGFTQKRDQQDLAKQQEFAKQVEEVQAAGVEEPILVKACSITNPDCESCQ